MSDNHERLKELLRVGTRIKRLRNDFLNITTEGDIKTIVKVIPEGVYLDRERLNCFLKYPSKRYKVIITEDTFTISKGSKKLVYEIIKEKKEIKEMKKKIKALVNTIDEHDLLLLGEKEQFKKDLYTNSFIIDYMIKDLKIDLQNMYFYDVFCLIWARIESLQNELLQEV